MFDGVLDFDLTASATEPMEVPCPVCHHDFGYEAWKVVNAGLDHMLAVAVKDGMLFAYTCPNCGYSDHLVHECMYLDGPNNACVNLVVSPGMAALAEVVFDGYEMGGGHGGVDGSRRRIVFNRFDLREKARVFSEGVDDRVIELVKLDIASSMRFDEAPHWQTAPQARFSHVHGTLLGFDVVYGSSQTDIVVPHGLYDAYAEALGRSSLATRDSYYIDARWARQALEVLETEQVL
ncbi:MAG: CpXC domain-containing protein [Coriobacteriales bacterium]|jgi:hypothetical protein